jgi:MSHA biogenesis protein MshM
MSRGVPRLVNVLAHKCLMLAYGENTHRVTLAHVRLAGADTPGVRSGGWRALRARWAQRWLERAGARS